MPNFRKFLILITLAIFAVLAFFYFDKKQVDSNNPEANIGENFDGGEASEPFSLSIDALKKGEYPGSDFATEQTLLPGSNYKRYVVSYKSEGLKIYALLTVPNGTVPEKGFPVVIFNHGYIPPAEYRTTERYVAYQDSFARNGYVTLKSDYRGHGDSEGSAAGGYGSNAYTIDVLNALYSVERLSYVNKEKIGMWGHSMGGFITLRAMVVRPDIKAGVIWGGVVASYPDLMNNWRRPTSLTSAPTRSTRGWRATLQSEYGTPQENPEFWNSISANSYLSDISGPVQLHHGTSDTSVPVEFSIDLEKQMKGAGKTVELYTYAGDDHNITSNFTVAANRSVEFFDKYLK